MTTTDVAIPDATGVSVELAHRGTIIVPAALIEKYPAVNPELDLTELLEGALGPGGKLRLSDLTRIKVPSAELTRLMVPDDDGESVPVSALRGIPVAMASRRSWWPDTTPSGKPPVCTSRDLEHGEGEYGPGSVDNPSGLCANCPMSQIGSMELIDAKRAGSKASACKEQKLLFLLTDRELLPLMLVVPPGSLQNHKAFGVGLAKRAVLGPVRPELGANAQGRPQRAPAWLAVEVDIALDQKTNDQGQGYNALTFKQVRKLSDPEREVISVYGMQIDELIVEQAAALDGVAAEAASTPGDGPVGQAPGDVEFDADGMPVDEVDLNDAAGTKVGAGAKGR